MLAQLPSPCSCLDLSALAPAGALGKLPSLATRTRGAFLNLQSPNVREIVFRLPRLNGRNLLCTLPCLPRWGINCSFFCSTSLEDFLNPTWWGRYIFCPRFPLGALPCTLPTSVLKLCFPLFCISANFAFCWHEGIRIGRRLAQLEQNKKCCGRSNAPIAAVWYFFF